MFMVLHHEISPWKPSLRPGTGRQRQLKVVAGRGKGEGDTLRQRAIWAKWLMNWEIPSEASELVSLLIHPE